MIVERRKPAGTHLSVPERDWPLAIREAWAVALEAGDLLDPGGLAAAWRPETRRHVMDGFGAWLAWLRDNGILGERARPGTECTPANVADFAEAMLEMVANRTVETRLVALHRALTAMSPEGNWSFIRTIIARLDKTPSKNSEKRRRVRNSRDLFDLGVNLMRRAERSRNSPYQRRVAALYRDGLMIALTAARPLRRCNLVGLELGNELFKTDAGWRITIAPSRTKTHNPIEFGLPQEIDPWLERYLDDYRGILLGNGGSQAPKFDGPVWISVRGGPLAPHSWAIRVCDHTKAAFGLPVNPHLFRDSAATTIAIGDPKQIRIAAAVLGHRSFETTQKHYNQARSIEAARAYQESLAKLTDGVKP